MRYRDGTTPEIGDNVICVDSYHPGFDCFRGRIVNIKSWHGEESFLDSEGMHVLAEKFDKYVGQVLKKEEMRVIRD